MEKRDKNRIILILVLYFLITILSNFLVGFFLAIIQNELHIAWLTEIYTIIYSSYSNLSGILSILSFVLPSVISIVYILPLITHLHKDKKPTDDEFYLIGNRILKLPLILSLTSFVGWFIGTFSFFLLSKFLHIGNSPYLFAFSVADVLFSGGLCFTISYFSIDSINRKFLIPHFFAGDSIFRLKKAFKFPVKLRFFIFYFALVVFPAAFSWLFILKIVSEVSGEWIKNLALLYLITGGVFFVLAFALTKIFTMFFQRPLRRLAESTEQIRQGDYDVSLHIESNDEIGILQHNIIVMSGTIKASSEKLKEYNVYLEEIVEKRTRDLVQAEKMASLGQMTAGIAHEIKNPLNFVNNFSQLSVELLGEIETMLTGSADVNAHREEMLEVIRDLNTNLEKIRKHGERADRIVAAMLEHSRGQSDLRRPAGWNTLVAEYLNLAYHGMRAKDTNFNITLETHYDPASREVVIVPQDVGRALVNIFNNAFHSTETLKRIDAEKGVPYQPLLTVRTSFTESRAVVRVRDNGTGIGKSMADKIFEPFFTTKPAGEGVGLGLSIAYDIVVKEHGGTIRAESGDTPGDSYFEMTVEIPLKE